MLFVRNVTKNVKFLLSRRKDDRLNVISVLNRGGREDFREEKEEILMLPVLNVERRQQFHLNQPKESRFFVEIVLESRDNKVRLTE